MRTHAGTHTPTRTHHHPLFLCLCYLSLCHSYQQHPIRSEAYLPGRLSFCSNASSRRDSLLCLTLIRFLDALTKLSAKARTLQGLGWRRLRLQSLVPISCSPERNRVCSLDCDCPLWPLSSGTPRFASISPARPGLGFAAGGARIIAAQATKYHPL